MEYLGYLIIAIIIFLLLFLFRTNISEGFTDGYIINLDHRTDRLNNIITQFKDLNIDLFKTSAIYNEFGWKGCGLSHISIIKMAKEKDMPYVIIIEDDCKPIERFNEIWPKIQDWLDKNLDKWDIYAGGNRYYSYHPNEKDTIIPICKINNEIKLYYTKFVSAQFYIINESAYDIMIEWETKMNNAWIPIDLWPDEKNLRIITSTPYLTTQEQDYSDIERSVKNYTEGFKKNEEILHTIPNEILCE